MKCPRCQNEDDRYFSKLEDRYYCRKCVGFQRTFVDENLEPDAISRCSQVDFQLDYELSDGQKKLSDYLVANYLQSQNSRIKAVCGAGKTEIVYQVIKQALNDNDRVCFTTPRKELVKELAARISNDFVNIKPTLLYGGHTKKTSGQFIICTTHQLYRFHQAFDLIIIDEVDAFPFKGDEILNAMFIQALKGHYIMMSATGNDSDFELNRRYHGGLLPEPKCFKTTALMAVLIIVKKSLEFKKSGRPLLIYVPSIKQAKTMARWLAVLPLRCQAAHSKTKDIEKILSDFRNSKLDCIVATTLLERGITVDNVQVIVYQGENRIYTRDTLIQICGRVGRNINHRDGEILICCNYKTEAIKQCIRAIKTANA